MVTASRRPRRVTTLAALGVSFVLIAAACSDKKDEDAVVEGGDDTTASTAPRLTTPQGPIGPATTTAPGTGETTPPAETTTPETTPKGVYGGTLRFGGEAEVGNPWTPANVQCDSYCYMRAFSIYDTLTARDDKLGWQPFLAESMTPNDDFTVWTVKLRKGIKFHDGTPFNADAAIYNLQQHATSFLSGPALFDIAKRSDTEFAIEKVDDMTFKIPTGRNGNPDEPIPWPTFPYLLSAQIGFMASPKWLEAVKEKPELAAHAVGTGPFVFKSMATGDRMVVERNENYWRKAPNGDQLPYLDGIEFRVLPDAQVRETALTSGDVDAIATSDGTSLSNLTENSDLRDDAAGSAHRDEPHDVPRRWGHDRRQDRTVGPRRRQQRSALRHHPGHRPRASQRGDPERLHRGRQRPVLAGARGIPRRQRADSLRPAGRCRHDRSLRGGERSGHGEVHDHGHGHHEGAAPTSSSRNGRASASTSTRPRSSNRR